MNKHGYSVLMSVYCKEKPEYLYRSMKSMFEQTVPPDDFVLVCDGPLTEELNRVVEEQKKLHPDVLQVVRLERNCGLGGALNHGMQFCRNDLIARMDSDDVARPERCEKQLKVFARKHEVCIVSGIVEEFSTSIEKIDARRIVPETHAEILKFACRRNPFNHPCVMYRKDAVMQVGGYQDFYLLEDYYLWIRMLQNGAKGYNLQEPILWMRAGKRLYQRRAGWKYAKSQVTLFSYMYEQRIISRLDCVVSCVVRTISAMMPNVCRQYLYAKLMRRAGESKK